MDAGGVTFPGHSSGSTLSTVRQFPQRDGAAVSDIAGMETPGWSNSGSVPEIDEPDEKAVKTADVEDKAVKTTARKTAQKKG